MAARTLTIAGAARPYPGEAVSGDAWHVDCNGDGWRIALIDGLGHGPEAAAAANAAIVALTTHPDLTPNDALAICHRALAGTRGGVIGVAQIDRSLTRLLYVGVGNIEARLWQPDREQRPISYRGIVGHAMPRARAFAFDLGDEWLFALHSDGLSTRSNLSDLVAAGAREPRALADAAMERWSRQTDDATIVVAAPGR